MNSADPPYLAVKMTKLCLKFNTTQRLISSSLNVLVKTCMMYCDLKHMKRIFISFWFLELLVADINLRFKH
mgnify:CR=1 FL=1